MGNIEGYEADYYKRKLFEQLELLIRKEKLYRDPSLNRSILAQHLRSNQTYVSGCVRHAIGKSLAEYLDALRLSEFVCRLKKKEGKCLFILAEEVGYSSYTTFYRAFVKSYGMSPGEYRQRINKR